MNESDFRKGSKSLTPVTDIHKCSKINTIHRKKKEKKAHDVFCPLPNATKAQI